MGQRHEPLPGLTAVLSYIVLDRGVSAVVAVLVPEALEDALGCVALLPGAREVILQDPVYDAGKRLQLGSSGRSLSPVARRRGVGQHLAHRVPVQAKLSADLPNALALHHHRPANPQIYVHLVHPSHHPWGRLQPYGRWRAVQFSTAQCQSVNATTWHNLPPPLTILPRRRALQGVGLSLIRFQLIVRGSEDDKGRQEAWTPSLIASRIG